MAVAALAEAGAALSEPSWLAAAEEIAVFLLAELRVDGRWRRSWQGGRAQHLAYASDHAWLVEAFTRLAEATGQAVWIAEARAAADAMLDLFWDRDGAGLHTSGRDAEALIARPKDTYDGAIPSANSVAAGALLRLGALTGSAEYEDRARAILDVMAPALAKAPSAFCGLVAAATWTAPASSRSPSRGTAPTSSPGCGAAYRPGVVLAWGEPYDSPLWEGRTDAARAGLAFVCRNYACGAPVSTPDDLVRQLAG